MEVVGRRIKEIGGFLRFRLGSIREVPVRRRFPVALVERRSI
ncbi:hypothetical protein COLO4_32212 [Corchorus olitorius]|uniref:Uncharacterized protein n=1 Tax=Corchorus olitorius TaxID=93759 RepID=A0A1R3H090_9ROSI|nr:hypothetical protein COLO4_32212 [Corchorus olitorius]